MLRFSTGATTAESVVESPGAEINDYTAGVLRGELAHDPLALARFIANHCVVAIGKHFILIDKPPNLSVWGHARSASRHFAVRVHFGSDRLFNFYNLQNSFF